MILKVCLYCGVDMIEMYLHVTGNSRRTRGDKSSHRAEAVRFKAQGYFLSSLC